MNGSPVADLGATSSPEVGAINEAIAFQISCMEKLDSKVEKKMSVEEQLKMHPQEYVKMIQTYPQLLNPSFKKGEPTHGIFHKIETGDHAPCKTKRRPIIMDSAKAAAGKAAWEQMERDGVIERVKADTNTDFSSALHLVPKPGGGARPCTDFRALNKMTIVDSVFSFLNHVTVVHIMYHSPKNKFNDFFFDHRIYKIERNLQFRFLMKIKSIHSC